MLELIGRVPIAIGIVAVGGIGILIGWHPELKPSDERGYD
jgi:hypothetical protein